MIRKQNICTTLSFISVLITAIGYCGDQSDGEENDQQQKPPDVISDTPEVVRSINHVRCMCMFVVHR
jgi:mannitol-1-phosphate/altronate dehydrogenase